MITALQLGYGTEWLEAMAEAYEAEHDIDIEIRTRIGIGSQPTLDSEIDSKASDTDLFFGKRGWFAEEVYQGSIFAHGQSYPCLYANLDDVWGDVVDEGTTLTIADKWIPPMPRPFRSRGTTTPFPGRAASTASCATSPCGGAGADRRGRAPDHQPAV